MSDEHLRNAQYRPAERVMSDASWQHQPRGRSNIRPRNNASPSSQCAFSIYGRSPRRALLMPPLKDESRRGATATSRHLSLLVTGGEPAVLAAVERLARDLGFDVVSHADTDA